MTSAAGRDDQAVHPLVRAAAAWSWRLLVIGAAAYALLWILQTMGVVVVSIAIALILTALLLPAVDFLDRYGAVRGARWRSSWCSGWPS